LNETEMDGLRRFDYPFEREFNHLVISLSRFEMVWGMSKPN
jgi:hypothetical protein